MKKKILFIFFVLVVLISNAQSPVFQWAKNMGGSSSDIGRFLAVDSLGNVYTTGSFQGVADFDPSAGTFNLTSNGITDIFISKLDASGNFVWAKNIGGSLIDVGYSITIDSFGNVYTTGSFSGTADFDPNAGTFDLTSIGGSDIFISKLDSSGNFVWAKNMGGTADENANSIAIDLAGNVYTTGVFMGTADFDPNAGIINLTSLGGSDIFISKLDVTGNFVFAKNMGGASYDYAFSITLDSSRNIYTTGSFVGTVDFDPNIGTSNLISVGGDDIFISKLDTSGNFVWAKNIGETASESGVSIGVDIIGNAYITGWFQGTADFDPNAGVVNLSSVGSLDLFVLKLDALGNFIWAKNMGGSSPEDGSSIAIDLLGNVYVTGSFNGTVDFDPGVGIYNLIPAGSADVFILKLDSLGNFVWAKNFGITSPSGFRSFIFVDASYNIYTAGSFQGPADFDFGSGTFNLTASGNDIFVHKMRQTISVDVIENQNIINIDVYPNPSNDLFNVIVSKPTQNANIEIYNGIGVLVHRQTIVQEVNAIELSSQPTGLYFLRVISDKKSCTTKILVKE